MTEENIQEVFELFKKYEDVIEKVKVVNLDEIRQKDYSLSVSNYIEKKPEEAIDVEKVKKEYFEAIKEVQENEDKMKKLLIEGGFING
jgi:type I restriction enzyme M protein